MSALNDFENAVARAQAQARAENKRVTIFKRDGNWVGSFEPGAEAFRNTYFCVTPHGVFFGRLRGKAVQ